MTSVQHILKKMARLWLLEQCARAGLLILALAVNACLLCLLLHRAIGVSLTSLAAVALLTVVALATLVIHVRLNRPSAPRLAQLLDQRAGARDLFASALEFDRTPDRSDWLGALTCDLAASQAAVVALRPRWSFGSPIRWVVVGSTTLVTLALLVAVIVAGAMKSSGNQTPPSAIANLTPPPRIAAPGQAPADSPKEIVPAVATTPEVVKETIPEPTTEPAVQVTNEMIDKYLAQLPTNQEVDLTGITPIRWEVDEANGKNNPQNQPPAEKIDPVKLDSALLKDLQDAKKKEAKAGGKEGGVDIAVMGDKGGTKVKGKEGGKDNSETLANAVSKDPRTDPTRMAIKPVKQGLQVRTFARTSSKVKGEERPMDLLPFLAALEKLKTDRVGEKPHTSSVEATRSEDRIVRQENVSDGTAGVTEAYFGQLRKADR